MDRRTIVASIGIGVLVALASGCNSTSSRVTVIDDHAAVALGAFSNDADDANHAPHVHRLGAGDSLGNSMYTVYLAHYRARQEEQRIVGVPTDGRGDD